MTHNRHIARRQPKRNDSFSWGRSIDKVLGGHVLTYRLFRRDLKGALHCTSREFDRTENRNFIALKLRQMRVELRERVDTIGYALIEAEASQLQEVA